MRLRTALQVGAIFPISLAILICITLVVRWRNMEALGDMLKRTEDLTTAVSDLDFATHQWVLTATPEMEAAWRKNHDNVGKILSGIKSPEPLVQVLLKSMSDTLRQSGETFAELAGIKTGRPPPAESQLFPGQQGTLNDLLGQIRTMIVDCSQITRAGQSSTMTGQQEMDVMITIWFGVLSLAMAGGMLVAGRRIMQRFEAVSAGIGAIADGKPDCKLEIHDKDELDEIMRSFNKMSQQFWKSQEALRKEAAERQNAAEALRRTNITLADALVKLKRAQSQAVDNARLGALSQIVNGIEHSFNNTLTPILALSDFLLAYPDSLNDREALIEHLGTISSAVKKAREQVDNMAEFFRPPARGLHSSPVNINDLVQQTVQAARHIWKDGPMEKGVTIKLNTEPGDIPIVAADHAGLCEAVTNLVANSVEAMPRGGTITISTRRDQEQVALRVRDDGEGMTEEIRSRCLEPFFSTKGIGSAGMGLTVVAGTVKRHGGTLIIESAPGAGTTVTINLPVHSESKAGRGQGEHGSQKARTCRVLVVDDEPWVLHLCTVALKAAGHEVVTAADGVDALKKFHAGHFDIAILDQAMPSMNGDELAGIIRKESAGTGIILLTGFADVILKEGTKAECVDMVLGKPVSIKILSDAVSKLMTGRNPDEADG